MSSPLSHLNARGEAHMVDVSEKAVTSRTAVAEGFVTMALVTLDMILDGTAMCWRQRVSPVSWAPR